MELRVHDQSLLSWIRQQKRPSNGEELQALIAMLWNMVPATEAKRAIDAARNSVVKSVETKVHVTARSGCGGYYCGDSHTCRCTHDAVPR